MSDPVPASLEEAWVEYLDALTGMYGAPPGPLAAAATRHVFYAGAIAAAMLVSDGNVDALVRDIHKMRADIDAREGR